MAGVIKFASGMLKGQTSSAQPSIDLKHSIGTGSGIGIIVLESVTKSKLHAPRGNESSFRPPWYLRSGHIQTILGPYALKRTPVKQTTRHEVPLLHEEGKTYLYESNPSIEDSSSRIREGQQSTDSRAILLVHGLGGDHSSPYLARIASQLLTLGKRVIRIDLPGCGPSACLSDRAAHAGCTDEMGAILRWMKREIGIEQIQIAGFSLGGNITLKLLAEYSRRNDSSSDGFPTIESAVVVAPPMDLAHCSDLIEQGFNQVYNRFFLKILKRLAKQRASQWPRWREIALRNRKPIKSIRQFDDVYTSQIAGFVDAADYYKQCATIHRLTEIAVPTSILMDHHDPIVPASLLDRVQAPSCIKITTSRRGGHVGYFYRPEGAKLSCWMDEWVIEQLTAANGLAVEL